ncbi:MAG: NAD-dependent epimerase/dehydratase family protein, partial [Lachnospiraceae bacterium]|nr:NAD-dependent epimerase/dehydratase family protein [Lachnospiraceae bacterium]
MIKKVIVTGGTGVTGNALVKYLLQQKIEVTALVRPGSFRRRFLPEGHPLLTVVDCGLADYGVVG